MKRQLIMSIVLAISYSAGLAQSTHDKVHALLLLGIAQNSHFPVTTREYTITVLGKSAIYNELTEHTRHIHINGLPVKVVAINHINELASAQIIYVTREMNAMLHPLITKTAQQPVLIVSAQPEHFKSGAEFSIVQLDSTTFRYNINQQALAKRNIRISRALANSAHSVIR